VMPDRDLPRPTRQAESAASVALARRLAHLSETRGAAAVPELRGALTHADPWVRAHAIEGLAGIDDDAARAALAEALHDDSFGVHWEAGRFLAAAGQAGVVAVLRALLHGTPSTSFLHGAAYVLHHAAVPAAVRATLAPVLDTLRRPVAALEAPLAAFAALEGLAPGTLMVAERPGPWYQGLRRRRGPGGQSFRPVSPDDATP
jgi:HEAT repeat protein